MVYAQNTTVSTDKSRAEIEKTLQRYGANQFMYGWQDEKALIAFQLNNRQVRFVLSLPLRTDDAFCKTPTGKARSIDAANKEWEQACRSKWRSLSLVIKAKLEAVDAQIAIFEDEFMANIVLPNNTTVGEFMRPQIERAYDEKEMPLLLNLENT